MVTVDVVTNPNCLEELQLVFQERSHPWLVRAVFTRQRYSTGAWCQVTGWDAECNAPCPAYAVKIDGSGAGTAILIYSARNGGLRFMPADLNRPWETDDPRQWSATHLVIADACDIQ